MKKAKPDFDWTEYMLRASAVAGAIIAFIGLILYLHSPVFKNIAITGCLIAFGSWIIHGTRWLFWATREADR